MATWVEDIVQALENLGGQATLTQIYEEVKRIRLEPLPDSFKASIRERIEAYSSDSTNFKGKDLFKRIDKGVWALREVTSNVSTNNNEIKHGFSGEKITMNREAEHMATWLEDIVQALQNLGGKATRAQIIEEVRQLRPGLLPPSWKEIISQHLQTHSSDSEYYDGKKSDLFKHLDNGIWALRYNGDIVNNTRALINEQFPKQIQNESNTWLIDITKSLQNLGGKGSLDQIYHEVSMIRQEPLPKNWLHIVQDIIYKNSSDTQKFRGNDLFQRLDNGVWALKNKKNISKPTRFAKKYSEPRFENYQLLEPLDEIANILRTIKQYRDYQHPDSIEWKEYIDEFFHILGFSTDDKNPRLMTLNILGTNHTPKALVILIRPGENFAEMVSGLLWESYAFFSAHYYHINWAIITDGLQMKIINTNNDDYKEQSYWPDLDGVVCQERLDTFCTIYKVFSFIKGNNGNPVLIQGRQNQSKQGEKDEDLAERFVLRQKFWGELLNKAKEKTKLHAKISPGTENWISAGAGKRGLGFNYVVRMDDAQVELYIDRGEAEWNKMVFNAFLQHKVEIEELFGGPLDWQLLPDKRASRIRFVISNYGLIDQDQWDELQEQLIKSMIRMEKAIRPFINLILSQNG